MRPWWPLVASAPLFAACTVGGRPDAGTEACHNGVDDDGDGDVDCLDRDCDADTLCAMPLKSCTLPRDCGDAVKDTYSGLVCLQQKCIPPGPVDGKGKLVEFDHLASAQFDKYYTSVSVRPLSLMIRIVYPITASGRRLGCAELVPLAGAGTECTRSAVDTLADLNLVYRNLIALNWGTVSGSQVVFNNLLMTWPQGDDFIVYAEAWWGGRTTGDRLEAVPTGNRAGLWCQEQVKIEPAMATWQAKFFEPCGRSAEPASLVSCPAAPGPCCEASDRVAYSGSGTCAPAGFCQYAESRQNCPNGCTAGACR